MTVWGRETSGLVMAVNRQGGYEGKMVRELRGALLGAGAGEHRWRARGGSGTREMGGRACERERESFVTQSCHLCTK